LKKEGIPQHQTVQLRYKGKYSIRENVIGGFSLQVCFTHVSLTFIEDFEIRSLCRVAAMFNSRYAATEAHFQKTALKVSET
jgi:hypothetical protein